jgi:hypothetical protein
MFRSEAAERGAWFMHAGVIVSVAQTILECGGSAAAFPK